MKHILTCTVVIFLGASAIAKWAFISTKELLKKTDLIVVARLSAVTEKTKAGIDHGSGTLTVSEVVRGSATAGQKLILKWSNPTGLACPRVEHRHHGAKDLIWLLQVSTNGSVRADYPGRVLDLPQREELNKLLKQ